MAKFPRYRAATEPPAPLAAACRDVVAGRRASDLLRRWAHPHGLSDLQLRLLHELAPDHVHVLVRGRIVESGGPDLAWQLEDTGYDRWLAAPAAVGVGIRSTKAPAPTDDPFADPLA